MQSLPASLCVAANDYPSTQYCCDVVTPMTAPSNCSQQPPDSDAPEWEGTRWFRALPCPEPPEWLHDRVMTEIAAYEQRRRAWRTVQRIARIMAITLFGLIVVIHTKGGSTNAKGRCGAI